MGSDPVGFGGMAVATDCTAVLWVNHKAAAVHTHLITIVSERVSPPVFTHQPTVFKKPETYTYYIFSQSETSERNTCVKIAPYTNTVTDHKIKVISFSTNQVAKRSNLSCLSTMIFNIYVHKIIIYILSTYLSFICAVLQTGSHCPLQSKEHRIKTKSNKLRNLFTIKIKISQQNCPGAEESSHHHHAQTLSSC